MRQFHKIPHLTIDENIGKVYWKDQLVEEYRLPWAFSEEGRSAALDPEKRCNQLEKLGCGIRIKTILWLNKYKEYQ
jgi:hypothetical protein